MRFACNEVLVADIGGKFGENVFIFAHYSVSFAYRRIFHFNTFNPLEVK